MVASVAAENLLRFRTDAVAVIHYMQIGLNFGKKRQRRAVAAPITEQGQGFTDNIPGHIKSRTGLGGLCGEIFGPLMINTRGSKQA